MTLGQFVRLKRGDKVAFVDANCKVVGIDYKREAVRIKCEGHLLGWHSYKDLVCEVLTADKPKPISNCLQCKMCDFQTERKRIAIYNRWGCSMQNTELSGNCNDFVFDKFLNRVKRFVLVFLSNTYVFASEFKKRVRR